MSNQAGTFRRRRWDPDTSTIQTETCPLVRSGDEDLGPVDIHVGDDTWTLGYASTCAPIGKQHNPFCRPARPDGTVDLRCGVSITPDTGGREQHHPAEDCFCGPTSTVRFSTAAAHNSTRKKVEDAPDAIGDHRGAPTLIGAYPPDLYDARTWRDGTTPPAVLSTSKKSLLDAATRVLYNEDQLRTVRALRTLFSNPSVKAYAAGTDDRWLNAELKSVATNYYRANGATSRKSKLLISESVTSFWQAGWRDDTVAAASTATERMVALRMADVEYGDAIDGAFAGDLTTDIDNTAILPEITCAYGLHAVSTDLALHRTATMPPQPMTMSFPVANAWRGYNGYQGIYLHQDGLSHRWDYGSCWCCDAWSSPWMVNDILDFPTDIRVREPFNVFAIGLASTGQDLRLIYARHFPTILRRAAACHCESPSARWMLQSLAHFSFAPRYLGLAILAGIRQSRPSLEVAASHLRHSGNNVIKPDWSLDSIEADQTPLADFVDTLATLFSIDLDGTSIHHGDGKRLSAELSKLGRDAPERSLIATTVQAYATLFDQALSGRDVESIAGDCIRLHDTLAQGRLSRVAAAIACMAVCYRGGLYQTVAALTTVKLPSPHLGRGVA